MLTDIQRRVAALVMTLDEASGFALAGAGALIARGEVGRTTQDLDYFATTAEAVDRLVPVLERALRDQGLKADRVQVTHGFARLAVNDEAESCLVDLAWDFRLLPPEPSEYGPILAGDELAADKVLALFGRAAARDFVDVFLLAQRHGRERLLELAATKDRGFDRGVFAEMLATMDRFDRGRFDVGDETFDEMRNFYDDWRGELQSFGSTS